jgi:hypothetical protein
MGGGVLPAHLCCNDMYDCNDLCGKVDKFERYVRQFQEC